MISGSSQFHIEAQELKMELEKQGYCVIDYTKKLENNSELEYKNFYETFFYNLNKTDDLIVLNKDKKGIKGYIGYNTFAELSFLVVRKIQNNSDHKIYLYKMPSKEVGCYDEINHFIKLGYIELFENFK